MPLQRFLIIGTLPVPEPVVQLPPHIFKSEESLMTAHIDAKISGFITIFTSFLYYLLKEYQQLPEKSKIRLNFQSNTIDHWD